MSGLDIFGRPSGAALRRGPVTSNVATLSGLSTEESILVTAGAAASVVIDVPPGSSGVARVINADGLSDTAVTARHAAQALRLGNSGSSVVLPSINLSAAADVGWTMGVLVRVNTVNQQAGTTHCRFLRIGAGSAYALLGYEGPNAASPYTAKLLMPNAAANGVVSLRPSAADNPNTAFGSANLGKWVWLFVRKHAAATTETVKSMSTGAEQGVTWADETVTVLWCPLLEAEPPGVEVYGAGGVVAAGAFSAANAAVTIGPDASNTGDFDIAKFFFLNQQVSAANLAKLATGKRPQDCGLTPNASTDCYYDLRSAVAADLLDVFDGAAATSAVLAGSDAVTPVANRPRVHTYLGNTGLSSLLAAYVDGAARRV